jgi:hypothetical protein
LSHHCWYSNRSTAIHKRWISESSTSIIINWFLSPTLFQNQVLENRLSSPSTHSQCFRVPACVDQFQLLEPASRFTSNWTCGNWRR